MAKNLGKKFELIFKLDFEKIPGVTIDRLVDPGFKKKGVRNICDFIAYRYPNIYYLECKSHKGNTFPLSCLTQYEKLILKDDIEGVKAGVVIWYIDKDIIIYVPISTFKQCFEEKLKSINIKMLGNPKYNIIQIPIIKKTKYPHGDYSIILDENK